MYMHCLFIRFGLRPNLITKSFIHTINLICRLRKNIKLLLSPKEISAD